MYQYALKLEAFPRYPQDGELLEMEEFEYQESEVNRNSPEYIRWVQNALNKVLGLRLAVDGKIGLATRSAIRSFQQRQGLKVDGIVGSKTETALKAALGGQGLPQTTPPLPGGDVGATSGGPEVLDKFEYNKDTLRPFHQAQIAKIAQAIVASQNTSQPIRSVRIVGHTDPVGPDWYNIQLGQRRAKKVRQTLIRQIEAIQAGLSRKIKFSIESLGERKSTGKGVEKDRRVEIFLPAVVAPPTNYCRTPPTANLAFVLWLKRALNRNLQLNLPFDTSLDLMTRSALRTFQQKQGLGSTGVIDRRTFLVLRKAYSEEPPCEVPDLTWQEVLSGGRSGNKVTALIRGPDTFKAMANAIKTANTSEHYIYLIAWHLTDNLILDPADPRSSIRNLFADKSNRGVQIRALIWDDALRTQNNTAVNNINRLRTGAAILDNNTLLAGSHHQKILIVKGDQGLITFCGGVDINPDRVTMVPSTSPCPPDAPGGSPLHDVHCKIEGPAAFDLLNVFVRRWFAHPDHEQHDRARGPLLGICENVPPPQGSQYVKIATTFNWVVPLLPPKSVHPRCILDRSLRDTMIAVIRRARKDIYIEGQYLVNMQAAIELRNALSSISSLVIVIGHSDISDLPQRWERRKAFIDYLLKSPHASKVKIYYRRSSGTNFGPYDYVHSKTWIIDEEVAIIGSANCNRRGWSHDSEVIAGIYDPEFARALKKRLLALHTPVWKPYNQDESRDTRIPCDSLHWDTTVDPDAGEKLGFCLNRPTIPPCVPAARGQSIGVQRLVRQQVRRVPGRK